MLSAFVLLAKPVVIVALLGAMRYRSRVSLETGLALAQISEFSLILGALGLRSGDIDDETMTLLTVVALVTIAASSYLLLNSEAIARRFAPALDLFERAPVVHPGETEPAAAPDVIVLGLGRYGEGIVAGLLESDLEVLGVDFDPVALSRWAQEGVAVLYGDAEDPELPKLLPLPESGWIVSTIRRTDANLALLNGADAPGLPRAASPSPRTGAATCSGSSTPAPTACCCPTRRPRRRSSSSSCHRPDAETVGCDVEERRAEAAAHARSTRRSAASWRPRSSSVVKGSSWASSTAQAADHRERHLGVELEPPARARHGTPACRRRSVASSIPPCGDPEGVVVPLERVEPRRQRAEHRVVLARRG